MFELMLTSTMTTINDGPQGQIEWHTPGTYTWIVPDDVYLVNVAALGAGLSGNSNIGSQNIRGGTGGGIRWKNNIPVTPGSSITVVVGSGGTNRSGTYNDVLAANGGGSSSAFDVIAGTYTTGTTITGDVGGFFGGYNGYAEGSLGKFVPGASAATFNSRGADSAAGAATFGTYLNGKAPDGAGYGFGGYAAGPSQAVGSSPKSVGKGGDGAVRIMWGGRRSYPSRVQDVEPMP